MSSHSAPEELLLDYATGALPQGPALAVALHAALDPAAARTVRQIGAMGGALLEREESAPMGDRSLAQVLARLADAPVEARPAPVVRSTGFDWAPPALARYLTPRSNWRRAFGGFEEIRLDVPGDDHRVSLLRLEPGKGLPVHRHAGAEYTVVLQGGYTDSTGNYAAGDFAVGHGENAHEPIADAGDPCIALIVLERPIVLTGPIGRWMNPLIRRGLL